MSPTNKTIPSLETLHAFCWVDYASTHLKLSMDYYTQLFGWSYYSDDTSSMGPYYHIRNQGKEMGGIYDMPSDLQQKGIPPHWNSYILVKNVDATVQQAQAFGAEVVFAPQDIKDGGRAAIIKDPEGTLVSLFQNKNPFKDLRSREEIGMFGWHELATHDTKKSKQFYESVFQWTSHTSAFGNTEYTQFYSGTDSLGGMMALPKEKASIPSHWLVYFNVKDCEQTLQLSNSLGGKVILPPMPLEKIGTIAVLQDPLGAVFAVYSALSP